MLVEVCREIISQTLLLRMWWPSCYHLLSKWASLLRNFSKIDCFIIINDGNRSIWTYRRSFYKEFYGNSYRALKEDGIMIYQHGSPLLTKMSRLVEACRRSIKPFRLAGTYQAQHPNQSCRLLVVLDCIEKYHPVKDFDKRKAGKKHSYLRILHYHSLHIGAFMLH